MVTCKLVGRTANQIIQIANVIAYAKRHDLPYNIPQRTVAPNVWAASFSHFPVDNYPYPYFDYKQPSFRYEEIPFRKHIRMDGFFQSFKFFDDQRQAVLDAFQFPYKMAGFVSIHVRRGDYLTYATKHPPITYEYISEAVKKMLAMGYNSFVVCSDDIKWCRENLSPLELYGAVFTYSSQNDAMSDFLILSCCEHNIIANSSFSLMAAWFNQNPDKIVISPHEDNWFGPDNKHLDVSDLIPEQWIRIKY